MRILYFSRDYTTHDRRFLLKLSETHHDVWFLRLENDGIPYEKRPLPDKIRLVEWRGGRKAVNSPEAWFRLMPDFQEVLDKIQPDLVHSGPVQSCGFMTAMAGFHPFLLMSWGSDILVDADSNDMWRWMTEYTLNHSDMLLCDSVAVHDKVKKLANYPDERVIQFPWGIDLKQFAPGDDSLSLRQQKGWENSFIILSTRTWEEIYGIEILLKAFHMAYTQKSGLRLVLLGAGSLSPRIEEFILRHNLDDVIYSPGMVPHHQLPEYYRAVDLYMSCSLSDGTSISLLEAFASGLPVTVTDLPGNNEWVHMGRNGWLAPPGDSESNAELLILATCLNSEERDRISRANRVVAEERANWNKNFQSLLEAYGEMGGLYFS